MTFFEWVAKCCDLMGKPRSYGKEMLPDIDPSWFYCYDDGLSPEEAVEEAKLCGLAAEEKYEEPTMLSV